MKFFQAWLQNKDSMFKGNNTEMVSLLGSGDRCAICSCNTMFYHKQYEVFMCSTECLDEMNNQFYQLNPSVLILN